MAENRVRVAQEADLDAADLDMEGLAILAHKAEAGQELQALQQLLFVERNTRLRPLRPPTIVGQPSAAYMVCAQSHTWRNPVIMPV